MRSTRARRASARDAQTHHPSPTDRRYLITDHQGTLIAEDGASVVRYSYGPYGEPSTWNGSRIRYTGQAALPEAQLYHYKARVYDPVLGRFLQTDPVGYEDDLNLYAYVRNDPLNRSDASGMSSSCVGSRIGTAPGSICGGSASDPSYQRQTSQTSPDAQSDADGSVVQVQQTVRPQQRPRGQQAAPPPNTPPRDARTLERYVQSYGRTHRSNSGYDIGGYGYVNNGVMVLVVARIDARPNAQGLRALDREIMSAARTLGAHRVEIYGLAIQNQGFFNPQIANRFGYSHETLPGGNVRIARPVE